MKISKSLFYSCLVSSGVMFLGSHTSYAGGTAVNGEGIRGSTMQAFTAVADDPSAIYYNPAGLTQLKGTNVQASATYIAPNVKYNNTITQSQTNSTHSVVGPSFFMSTDKIPHIAFGIGVYAPFARSIDYDINSATYNNALRGLLLRTDIVPTAAIDFGPYISLGVGLVISKTQNETNILGFHESSDGYGYTGQGGLLIKLPGHVKLGFNYRGPMTTSLDGNGSFMGMTGHYNATLDFPGTYSFGAAWQATPKWLLSAQMDIETWSNLRDFHKQFNNPILTQVGSISINAYDSKDYRFGTAYKLTSQDELRAGYSYIEAAIPTQNMVPIQPETNYNAYSVGYSHTFGCWRVDGGYELDQLLERQSLNSFFPGTSKGIVHNIMAGIMYTFS